MGFRKTMIMEHEFYGSATANSPVGGPKSLYGELVTAWEGFLGMLNSMNHTGDALKFGVLLNDYRIGGIEALRNSPID